MKRFSLTGDMNIGWNLGNTMDAYPRDASTMLPPLTSETLWHNAVTTKRLIDTIAEAGFDVLRVPTTWDRHFIDEPGYPIDPKWMARVREIVCYGLQNNMRVILNMHHEGWHFPSAENKQVAQEKLTALWTQIAEAFKDIGNDLIFEGMNEPRMNGTPLEWQGGTPEAREIIADWQLAFVKAVRATGGNNATRRLMIAGNAAATEDAVLDSIKLPENDKNIIISAHAYLPYPFALAPGGTEAFSSDNPDDRRDIDNMLARLEAHFLSRGIPVVIGEFGSQNRNGNITARADNARYYVTEARAHGVPCVWWDNGYVVTGDELFGLIDRETCEWIFPDIVKALIEPTKG